MELMTRIKKVEDDVELLKQERDERALLVSREAMADEDRENRSNAGEGSAPYIKTTDQMIDMCYRCGKKLLEGESAPELAEGISDETGMNRNSAFMYLYAVKCMLEGTIYKRSISAKAMQRYFDAIFNEYGSQGLKKAIKATKEHIEYRRSCGHQVDSIEALCNRYENRL